MAETGFKYDVFISYSHKDEAWAVNTLLPALENAGLSVCIDYRDFDAGKPSIVNMEDAVDESRHTVLVLTPNWTGSEWTDFEAILTQTDDPAGRRQKLIPIMLEKCTPPKRVKSLTYVDFMRSDRLDNAWTQLFKALGKPNAPVPTSATPKPDTASRNIWHLAHPYPMPPNFTGRTDEQKMLDDWLSNDKDRLFILHALGGFGKSALAWQWINTHVNPTEWTKLVFWSFYEGDASFENFIEETLKYLKLEVPQGQRPQVAELLDAMKKQKILLIMDGFERVLRLYGNMNAAYQSDEEKGIEENQLDCVNINAEIFLKNLCVLPNIMSKVLMTTRLTPRALKTHDELLQGCVEKKLKEMDKTDAVAFFHAQGIQGNRSEIEATCAPYGYHPLSLRILAGLIANDREYPNDVKATEKLDITDNIIQNKNHVLKVAYDTLSLGQQKLLSNIACSRSPMSYQVLKVISSKPSWKRGKNKHHLNENLDSSLQILEARGLLHWDRKVNKYDLHPIVRRYAYDRLTAYDRTAAHTRLRDYFATIPVSEKIEKLENFAPTIERYYHSVRAGELDNAVETFGVAVHESLYYQLGAYQTVTELLKMLFLNDNYLPSLKSESWQAWVLNSLAISYSMTGRPADAVPLLEKSIEIRERINPDKVGTALANLANQQIALGSLKLAEVNIRREISIRYESDVVKISKKYTHPQLGRLFSIQGLYTDAEKEFEIAYRYFEVFQNGVQAQCYTSICRAQNALLMTRNEEKSIANNQDLVIQFAQHALELAMEFSKINRPIEHDFVIIHWLLGAAHRLHKRFDLADDHLIEALARDRTISDVDSEANILLDLARLRYDQKNYEEAKSLADEALLITERCGYVLQGADVNLFLAQYALEHEQDKVKAKAYAEEAKKLATCDGPPYYYKVAYEEAERFLEQLAG